MASSGWLLSVLIVAEGDAVYAHNTGRGRKIVMDSQTGKAVWINPDLTKLERDARLNARKERQQKRREEDDRQKTTDESTVGASSDNAPKNVD